MPYAPPRVCGRPGCGIKTIERFCPLHAAEHKRNVQADTDSRRGSAASRGYDAKWRRIRALFLKQNPLCQDVIGADRRPCLRPATDVDHKVPLRRGGTNKFDNLQALCHTCHSRKTVREDGGFGRARG